MTPQLTLSLTLLAALVYLAALAAAAIVGALRAGGWRDDEPDSHPAVSASRFTIPVSVILPVTRPAAALSNAIAAALALNYPELEVIVVVDSAKSAEMDSLTNDWQLQAREFFYRRSIDTAPVRRIHRSLRNPRVMVIDKTDAGYGDALNCGINVARYRYVVALPPDIVFDADALLRLMAPAFRDAATVVGVSNHVERGGFSRRLAHSRSLMESRLAWAGMRCGLGPDGAVVAWRRDAIVKARGFSQSAADPDLDMMFRLQSARADGGVDGRVRIERAAEVFGRIASQSPGSVLTSTGRRQRAAIGLMLGCLRRGPGALDATSLALFLALDLLVPCAQAWLVIGTLTGAALGWLPASAPLWALVLLSFGNAAVSVAGLLLRGAGAGAPATGELTRLVAASPLEFLLVRPALAGARIVGMLSPGSRTS